MIFEFLPQISFSIFILALVGYISKYFYNMGYYHDAYNPLSHQPLEKFFKDCSFGVILILIGLFFIFSFIGTDAFSLPEQIRNMSVSDQTAKAIIASVYALAFLMVFIAYLALFSLLFGFGMSFLKSRGIILKTNENDCPEIKIREIYSENEDFIYYITLEGNWGSIRKSCVQGMEEVKSNSKFESWLKKDKKHIYYVILALVIYLLIIFLFRVF